MDWMSRYVLAWGLSNLLEASFCVEALEEALGKRPTRDPQHRTRQPSSPTMASLRCCAPMALRSAWTAAGRSQSNHRRRELHFPHRNFASQSLIEKTPSKAPSYAIASAMHSKLLNRARSLVRLLGVLCSASF